MCYEFIYGFTIHDSHASPYNTILYTYHHHFPPPSLPPQTNIYPHNNDFVSPYIQPMQPHHTTPTTHQAEPSSTHNPCARRASQKA